MNKPLFLVLAIAFSIPAWLSTAVAREKPYEGKCLYIRVVA